MTESGSVEHMQDFSVEWLGKTMESDEHDGSVHCKDSETSSRHRA